MLPFARVSKFGNVITKQAKVDYDFNANVSNGVISASWSSGTFGVIPAVPTNTYGYTRGASSGTLTTSTPFSIGTLDCIIEATYYCASSTNINAGIINFGGPYPSTSFTGIQYADSGYGYRLSGYFGLGSNSNGVHCIAHTTSGDYQKVLKFRIERKSGVERIYLNGVQQTFSLGSSTTYSNTSVPNTANIANQSSIQVGSGSLYLARLVIDY